MSSTKKHFDIIIVGAGPAGMACAFMLSKQNLSVALVDKARFPRDKICGDALSLDVVNQLHLMSSDLGQAFLSLEPKMPSYGIKMVSPGAYAIELPLYRNGEKQCGYVCERLVFDNFFFEQIKQKENIHVFQETTVLDIKFSANRVEVITDTGNLFAKVIVGADGANSIVNKKTLRYSIPKNHLSVGIRQYFKNVSGFHTENFIELHFFKEIAPGYLWIFPLPGNKANVGIGMLASTIAEKKINLRDTFQRLLSEQSSIRDRFAEAEPLEPAKGYNLPLGSKKRKISGERFLLIGDAASMIDPFSGEGVANAIRSGRVAAEILVKAVGDNDLSASRLYQYDQLLYKKIGLELKVSRQLQNLSKRTSFFDFIAKKTQKSAYLKQFMNEALANVHKKKLIVSPRMIYHLFFK